MCKYIIYIYVKVIFCVYKGVIHNFFSHLLSVSSFNNYLKSTKVPINTQAEKKIKLQKGAITYWNNQYSYVCVCGTYA